MESLEYALIDQSAAVVCSVVPSELLYGVASEQLHICSMYCFASKLHVFAETNKKRRANFLTSLFGGEDESAQVLSDEELS